MDHSLQVWLSLEPRRRVETAYRFLLELITEDAMEDDQYLNTDFSKWSYFRQKYQIKGENARFLYKMRTAIKSYDRATSVVDEDHQALLENFVRSIAGIAEGSISPDSLHFEYVEIQSKNKEYQAQIQDIRLLVTGVMNNLVVTENPEDGRPYLLELSDLEVFDGQSIISYFPQIGFPFFLQAFNLIKNGDNYQVGYCVLQPDYLVDVTSIAMGFVSREFVPWVYINQKLLPKYSSYHMMLGNIVNTMLDVLIRKPDTKLEVFYTHIFQAHSVQIGQMSDDDVRMLMVDVKKHYENLYSTTKRGFEKIGVHLHGCSLETSFISNKYGLQGRLDVLYLGDHVSIIELKSGKPYKPNAYGIKTDHYIQTLLYDLLLKSAGISHSSRNFILYSGQNQQTLRYAPPLADLQQEALRARNQIVLIDHVLGEKSGEEKERLFHQYLCVPMDQIGRFVQRDTHIVKDAVKNATTMEWRYYLTFLGFVQREMMVAKLGRAEVDGRTGQAGLWLSTSEEKDREYGLLGGLRFSSFWEDEGELLLVFDYTEKTNVLANFRVGDVVVLYPQDKGPLHHQVIKGSLILLDNSRAVLRPRGSQLDRMPFEKDRPWAVERDVLDSSFRPMFEGLFLFLSAEQKEKQRWLGQEAPQSFNIKEEGLTFSSHLLEIQKDVVRRAFFSKDYFLIWGPPGTGKTNVVLRELIRMYFEHTEYDIYLLAYTNRAVDEMTDVVMGLDEMRTSAVRLGSKYSVAAHQKEMLLNHQLKRLMNRRRLNEYLLQKRIILSTLSSFWNQRNLVKSKVRSVLIVDEASQILEPSLVGLLGQFVKVILIGDHLQLPAVSVQNDAMGKITDASLTAMGFDNAKTSLFHRLLLQCQRNDWHHAIGLLSQQGRMHEEIMTFVNTLFYQGRLQLLPGIERLEKKTSSGCRQQRLIYLPSQAYPLQKMLKNNEDEAQKAIRFIQLWLADRGVGIEEISADEIGIITPFRAQIALLRHHLFATWGSDANKITVDTVERYQGSARDLIVISVCLNRPGQLSAITSRTSEGIDRKMNVAITRAREQVVLIGNREILMLDPNYRAFLNQAREISMSSHGRPNTL